MKQDVWKYLKAGAIVPVDMKTTKALVDALKEALAQEQEQEPVAWMYVNTDGECEQIEYGEQFDDPSTTPLYTTPPQRKWVGLTDDEVQDAGRFSYCRGGTSENLYHIMWNSQPSASIGWSREELIAFANAVAAHERERITAMLMYLHNQTSAYHNYYKHAAIEINRKDGEGENR